MPNGYIGVSQSFCPLAELKKTETYHDLFVPSGIEHGIFALMKWDKAVVTALSLYRDQARTEFTDSDLLLFRFLSPHLQRAVKQHFYFSALRSQSEEIQEALDMSSTGVVFLGEKGEIVLMNKSASALFSERDGLLATRDGIRAERPAESAMLTKAIQQASSTNGNGFAIGGTVLISRRTRTPLQIVISPIRNSAVSAISTGQRFVAVAFVTDPSRTPRPTQDILRARFGLTPAECRVALLLSDGHAPRKIANMIGVADNTVRSQIKSIFSKTGVRRQRELIRLLLNNPGVTTQAKPTL